MPLTELCLVYSYPLGRVSLIKTCWLHVTRQQNDILTRVDET